MHHKIYKKVILVVLDGFGVASYSHGNAVALANTEVLNFMVSHFPSMTLQASGPLVGLPWGEMGNSEVGHLNMGAGRIVGQDLPRINKAIETKEFFSNPTFLQAMDHVKKHGSKLHLAGLVSSGGVHSSAEHLYALLAVAAECGVNDVYIHMFTDGRDTAEKVALDSLQQLRAKIKEIGVGQIATLTGRFYAMDRGKHWDQTELTFQAMVNGIGSSCYTPEDCVLDNYSQEVYDEMIRPTVVVKDGPAGEKQPMAKIEANDALIFFNFRPDRALQLTQAFVQPEVMDISSKHAKLDNLFVVTMTEYFFGWPVAVAFPAMDLRNNLAEVLSKHKYTQFHIAESEKYAHVTSFFNGGVQDPFPGEERHIVSSPNNSKNYVDQPEMSALELTDVLVEKMTKSETNFYLANYANPDVVGHTGNLESAIKAVKYIDRLLERLMTEALSIDAALLITGDHGNIEQMVNSKTGEIDKDHTTNPVPLLFIANEFKYPQPNDKNYLSLSAHVPDGAISDIAPTVLSLFGLPKPEEMNGIDLFEQL